MWTGKMGVPLQEKQHGHCLTFTGLSSEPHCHLQQGDALPADSALLGDEQSRAATSPPVRL